MNLSDIKTKLNQVRITSERKHYKVAFSELFDVLTKLIERLETIDDAVPSITTKTSSQSTPIVPRTGNEDQDSPKTTP